MPYPSLSSPSDVFATYLVPALPFRRRTSSIDSTVLDRRSSSASSASTSPSSPPGESLLSGHASHLRCSRCLTDLALANQIISKGFTGRHGRAYLVAPSSSAITSDPLDTPNAKVKNNALPNLPNTFTHKPVPRQLVTGAHTVSDISCSQCGNNLGWKYVSAEEESQKYKVGKFILETKKVCRSSTWDSDDAFETSDFHTNARRRSSALPPNQLTDLPEDIEFDSQDEDECEDLFLGTWSPQSAARRRKSRLAGRSDSD